MYCQTSDMTQARRSAPLENVADDTIAEFLQQEWQRGATDSEHLGAVRDSDRKLQDVVLKAQRLPESKASRYLADHLGGTLTTKKVDADLGVVGSLKLANGIQRHGDIRVLIDNGSKTFQRPFSHAGKVLTRSANLPEGIGGQFQVWLTG